MKLKKEIINQIHKGLNIFDSNGEIEPEIINNNLLSKYSNELNQFFIKDRVVSTLDTESLYINYSINEKLFLIIKFNKDSKQFLQVKNDLESPYEMTIKKCTKIYKALCKAPLNYETKRNN